jgi:hypothetical protein
MLWGEIRFMLPLLSKERVGVRFKELSTLIEMLLFPYPYDETRYPQHFVENLLQLRITNYVQPFGHENSVAGRSIVTN